MRLLLHVLTLARSTISVIIRYDPRDITTVFVYQIRDSKEVFLARAHAQGWEAETLSYREAQVISQRRRAAGKAVDNRSMLEEVRDRDEIVKTLKRQKKKNQNKDLESISQDILIPVEPVNEIKDETVKEKKLVPYVNVYDYEQMKRDARLV